MLCGGISHQPQITEFASAYVGSHHADINSALSVNNSHYNIVHEAVQVAAGVSHFLHVTGSDGKPYTVTIIERIPPHEPIIIEVGHGHLDLKYGYGQIVHPEHPHHPQHQHH